VSTKTKPAKAGYQNWRAHLLMRRKFFGSAGALPSRKITAMSKSVQRNFVVPKFLGRAEA